MTGPVGCYSRHHLSPIDIKIRSIFSQDENNAATTFIHKYHNSRDDHVVSLNFLPLSWQEQDSYSIPILPITLVSLDADWNAATINVTIRDCISLSYTCLRFRGKMHGPLFCIPRIQLISVSVSRQQRRRGAMISQVTTQLFSGAVKTATHLAPPGDKLFSQCGCTNIFLPKSAAFCPLFICIMGSRGRRIVQRSKKWLVRGLVKFATAVARLVCPDLLG